MIFPILYAGCDLDGEWGKWSTVEIIYGFDPRTDTIEVLGTLFHPVFPHPLPIELKGIAV